MFNNNKLFVTIYWFVKDSCLVYSFLIMSFRVTVK